MNGTRLGELVTNVRYLGWAFAALLVLGAVATWLGIWIGSDIQPQADVVIGTVLGRLASGLLIGAGLLATVGALLLVCKAIDRNDE